MFARYLALFVACAATAVASASANPQSFSVHIPDLNPRDATRILAADQSGSLFVISTFARTSAIVNIHVVKTDASGNTIATFDFGGSAIDTPNAAAVDPDGNLFVVGATGSPDFPLVAPLQKAGTIFVTKIDAQLSGILFSTLLGGSAGGQATAVAVDSSGNAYVTGTTGAGFATTPGVLQLSAPLPTPPASVSTSGFITEIASSGAAFVFSTYFAGSGYICGLCSGPPGLAAPVIFTAPSAIAVDATGSVVISGISNADDLPVSAGAYAQQCGCTNNVAEPFIAKLSPGGTQMAWGTYLPVQDPSENQSPAISGMALDSSGNVILSGKTGRGLPATVEAIQSSELVPAGFGPAYSGFAAKLDSSGSELLFATYFGGSTELVNGSVNAVAVDGAGTIWLAGTSALPQLPVFSGGALLGTNYLANLSSDGSDLMSLFTAPNGAADIAVAVTSQNVVAALGSGGSLLISSSSAQPYMMGIAESPSPGISTALCARELVSIYGIGVGPTAALNALVTNDVIGNSLGGVQILFNGVPAALLYAGPNQINAIVPRSVAGRETATIQIVTPQGTIEGPVLAVRDTLPQVFADATGAALALNQDGTVNSPSSRAQPGTILTIWMTGAGGVASSPDDLMNTSAGPGAYPISVLTGVQGGGFTSLLVLYAGDAPGSPSGVTQINFQLPPTIEANGYPLFVQAGAASAGFIINVID